MAEPKKPPTHPKVLKWEHAIAAGLVTRADAAKVLEKYEPHLAKQLRENTDA